MKNTDNYERFKLLKRLRGLKANCFEKTTAESYFKRVLGATYDKEHTEHIEIMTVLRLLFTPPGESKPTTEITLANDQQFEIAKAIYRIRKADAGPMLVDGLARSIPLSIAAGLLAGAVTLAIPSLSDVVPHMILSNTIQEISQLFFNSVFTIGTVQIPPLVLIMAGAALATLAITFIVNSTILGCKRQSSISVLKVTAGIASNETVGLRKE